MPTESNPQGTEPPVGPVEQAIRDAIARGEFDRLPGVGRPLPDIDRTYDPDWWARRYVDRARTQDAADELRRTIREELPRLRVMKDRGAATERVAALNRRIVEVNSGLSEGEPIPLVEL